MATTTTSGTNGATGKTGSARQVNAIFKYKIAAIKEGVMLPVLKKLKIPFDDLTKDEMGVALAARFHADATEAGQNPDDVLAGCPECNAPSPETYVACPFCGEKLGEPIEAEAAAPPAATTKKGKAKEPEAPAAAPAKARPLEAVPNMKTDDGPVVGTVDDKGRTLVHVKGGAAAKLSAVDLDKAVEDVQLLKNNIVGGFFALGIKIKEIVDRGLWKMRKREDGTSRWAHFDAFCNAELKMSPGQASELKGIVETFTQEQAKKLPQSKLGLLLKVPDSVREELLGKTVAEQTPVRQLREQVKQENAKVPEEERPVNRSQQAKAGAAGGRKKAEAAAKKKAAAAPAPPAPKVEKREDKITVAQILKKQTIKMYAKPASMRGGVVLEDCKRAMKIAQKPYGRLVLANDVSIWVEVRMGAKGIEIIAEARRDA